MRGQHTCYLQCCRQEIRGFLGRLLFFFFPRRFCLRNAVFRSAHSSPLPTTSPVSYMPYWQLSHPIRLTGEVQEIFHCIFAAREGKLRLSYFHRGRKVFLNFLGAYKTCSLGNCASVEGEGNVRHLGLFIFARMWGHLHIFL